MRKGKVEEKNSLIQSNHVQVMMVGGSDGVFFVRGGLCAGFGGSEKGIREGRRRQVEEMRWMLEGVGVARWRILLLMNEGMKVERYAPLFNVFGERES